VGCEIWDILANGIYKSMIGRGAVVSTPFLLAKKIGGAEYLFFLKIETNVLSIIEKGLI
jgi:hypothetical protein